MGKRVAAWPLIRSFQPAGVVFLANNAELKKEPICAISLDLVKLIHEDLTYAVRGVLFDIHNYLGLMLVDV